jgi:NitT/TauT family transport system ATP-binding protein
MALKLNKNKERMSLNEIISLIELTGYESHFPDNKSYGFRFRIALGRALAVNPLFVLADDSFRIMDPETKTEIYDLIKNICSKSEITFIAATADISEAVILSDRILLMRKNPGRIFYDYRKRDSSLKDWSDLNGFREEIQRLYRNEDLPQNMQLTI